MASRTIAYDFAGSGEFATRWPYAYPNNTGPGGAFDRIETNIVQPYLGPYATLVAGNLRLKIPGGDDFPGAVGYNFYGAEGGPVRGWETRFKINPTAGGNYDVRFTCDQGLQALGGYTALALTLRGGPIHGASAFGYAQWYIDGEDDVDLYLDLYATFDVNQWLNVKMNPSGDWSIGHDDAAPLYAGTFPFSPTADSSGFFLSTVDGQEDDNESAELLVDHIAVWLEGVAPVVRLFPRDDGRGMSSAPRIWPPSASQRVIGGLQ